LTDEVNPGGKLVVSWPRTVGQEPLYYDALNTGRPAENIDLTRAPKNGDEKYVSRYIDAPNSPQFPFGYGLSYSNYRYGRPRLSKDHLSAGALNAGLRTGGQPSNVGMEVSADVTNTGTRAGEETVQLYVRLQGTSVALPVRALSGFQRVAGHLRRAPTRSPAAPLTKVRTNNFSTKFSALRSVFSGMKRARTRAR